MMDEETNATLSEPLVGGASTPQSESPDEDNNDHPVSKNRHVSFKMHHGKGGGRCCDDDNCKDNLANANFFLPPSVMFDAGTKRTSTVREASLSLLSSATLSL